MKTIKVCGRRTVLGIAGFCLVAGSCLSGCASKNIPYRQLIYKTTYNYLRAVECQNTEQQQLAYVPCARSYSDDFDSYSRLREQYVNNLTGEDQLPAGGNSALATTEAGSYDSQLLVLQ